MLVKCNECGKYISDQAIICPSCGIPITESVKKNIGGHIIVYIITIILAYSTLNYSTNETLINSLSPYFIIISLFIVSISGVLIMFGFIPTAKKMLIYASTCSLMAFVTNLY